MEDFETGINDHHDGLHILANVASELQDIARNLSAVGLEKLANRIAFAGDDVSVARDKLRGAYSDQLNQQLRATQDNAAGMLSLILNGNLVATPGRPTPNPQS